MVFGIALLLALLTGELGALCNPVTQPTTEHAAFLASSISLGLHGLIWILQRIEHRGNALLGLLEQVFQVQQDSL